MVCLKCNQQGHSIRKCRSLKREGSKSKDKFQEIRKCNQCHQSGFLSKACQLSKKSEAVHVNEVAETSTPSVSQGRSDVLEGTRTVKNIPVKVLFDTGTSRSFIAKNAVKKLDLKLRKLKEPITVHNPVGGFSRS